MFQARSDTWAYSSPLCYNDGNMKVRKEKMTMFKNSVFGSKRKTEISILASSTDYNGFPRWLSGKESTCQAGDVSLIPGSGQSPGGENDNPLQFS